LGVGCAFLVEFNVFGSIKSGYIFAFSEDMQNQFVAQGVEVVREAIDADNGGDYERALPLYKRALEYFMTGLKYEQNPAGMERCQFWFVNSIVIVLVS
jgi:hypothetical protein